MNVPASPRSGESISKGPASSTRFLQATFDVEPAMFYSRRVEEEKEGF